MPKGKILLLVLAGLLLVSGGSSVYFYRELVKIKTNPQALAQKEVAKVMAQVSKLIVLPEGETPTIATVADPEKLKDQPFFNKAKKGDKVLIFTASKKAILYSPSENIIIDVAPLNIGGFEGTPAGARPQPGAETDAETTP